MTDEKESVPVSRHDYQPGPCPTCERERDRLTDEDYELYVIGKRVEAFESTLATDQEWAAHLDQVAPVVSFRSKPFTHSCPSETL